MSRDDRSAECNRTVRDDRFRCVEGATSELEEEMMADNPNENTPAASEDSSTDGGNERVRLRRRNEQGGEATTERETSSVDTPESAAQTDENDADAATQDAAPSEGAQPSPDRDDGDEQDSEGAGAGQGDATPAPRRRVFDPQAEKRKKRAARKRKQSKKPKKPENEATRADFASMLAAEKQVPSSGAESVEPGQRVSGEIVQLGKEFAFVDLGAKTEAFIPIDELRSPEGEVVVDVGDKVTARVVRVESGGQVRLGLRASGGGVKIQEAFRAGIAVRGTVKGTNKGGFDVEVMGQDAFCPISHIDVGYTEDPEQFVGQTLQFKVIEYAQDGRRIVVSRSKLLEEERKEQAKELREKLEEGKVLEGTVSNLKEYGAFVDLGGIDGLVHISEISHKRIGHPNEVLEPGQKVDVKVLSIEETEKGERIALSIKGAQEDPWDNLDWLEEGERYVGKVVRLAPFGAFVELKPGVEGLVHVSEMSWERHVRHPKDVVSVGDQIEVAVLNIDAESRRIGLSLKAALGDPWEGVEERYPVGMEVTGTVDSIADFGVFVKVEKGVVALIPMSELDTERGVPAGRKYKPDQEVTAKVIAADETRRRLTLSRKDERDRGGRQSGRRQGGSGDRRSGGGGRRRGKSGGRGQSYEDAGGSFATLGDLLQDASNSGEE